MENADRDQVILLSAPAGHGKTQLLADWSEIAPERVAWASLDSDDNDDRQFWAVLLAALTDCPAVPADSRLRALGLPDLPSHDPTFRAAFTEAIRELPSPIRLVLDDVHELTAAAPLHGLDTLIRDRTPNLQLVLGSRCDPPVQLGKLRLADGLVEVRADGLAFSLAEAGALMTSARIDIRADQLRILLDQTAGWAAGLRLAALSLRDAADPDGFLSDLVGNGRAISDYLVTEILSRLAPEVRELLDAACVSELLPAGLAVALSGRADAGQLLSALETQTSLVVSQGEGRRWFRIHPLLRSHLVADLRRRRPQLVGTLHERAARWYDGSEPQPTAALSHAAQSGNTELVVELLSRNAMALFNSGRHSVIRNALDACPSEQIEGDPAMLLTVSLAYLESGAVDRADTFLVRADEAWPAEAGPELQWLRSMVHGWRAWLGDDWRADMNGLIESAATVGQTLPSLPQLDAFSLLAKASAAAMAGRLNEGRVHAQAAITIGSAENNTYLMSLATTVLAIIAGTEGNATAMAELADRAANLAPISSTAGTQNQALVAALGALAAILQGRPERAATLLAPALEFKKTLALAHPAHPAALTTLTDFLEATIEFDRGNKAAGLEALRRTRCAARPDRLHTSLVAAMANFEHFAARQLGRPAHARAVLEWAQEHVGTTGDVRYLRATGPAAISRYDAAQAQLKPALDGTVPTLVQWVRVDSWLLDCSLALKSGRRVQATRSLREALTIAQRLGTLRPLINAPSEVAEFLADQVDRLDSLAPFAQSVLAARNLNGTTGSAPLTQREQAVLALLPTLMSLDEIAKELSVSTNTVKTHVKAIYGKLGASSRRQAVAAARTQGILGGGEAGAG